MGGKSRKSGGVSKTLINRIKKGKAGGSGKGKDKPKTKRKGLLENDLKK